MAEQMAHMMAMTAARKQVMAEVAAAEREFEAARVAHVRAEQEHGDYLRLHCGDRCCPRPAVHERPAAVMPCCPAHSQRHHRWEHAVAALCQLRHWVLPCTVDGHLRCGCAAQRVKMYM